MAVAAEVILRSATDVEDARSGECITCEARSRSAGRQQLMGPGDIVLDITVTDDDDERLLEHGDLDIIQVGIRSRRVSMNCSTTEMQHLRR